MTLVAFCPEEQVEAFGRKFILRLDFGAITTIEGMTQMPMPLVSAHIRSGPNHALRGMMAAVVWAMLRKHNPEVTHDEALGSVMDTGEDGTTFGFAVDALLERCFPLSTEDKEPKNAKGRNGRSKSTAEVG